MPLDLDDILARVRASKRLDLTAMIDQVKSKRAGGRPVPEVVVAMPEIPDADRDVLEQLGREQNADLAALEDGKKGRKTFSREELTELLGSLVKRSGVIGKRVRLLARQHGSDAVKGWWRIPGLAGAFDPALGLTRYVTLLPPSDVPFWDQIAILRMLYSRADWRKVATLRRKGIEDTKLLSVLHNRMRGSTGQGTLGTTSDGIPLWFVCKGSIQKPYLLIESGRAPYREVERRYELRDIARIWRALLGVPGKP